MSFGNLLEVLKGGTGSGNFAHSGRPGKIGGSSGGGGMGGGFHAPTSKVGNYQTRIITVGPRSGQQTMLEVPSQVKLDPYFMREGLSSFGGKGTKADLNKTAMGYVLRVQGKGPAAFSESKDHLERFNRSQLQWEIDDNTNE